MPFIINLHIVSYSDILSISSSEVNSCVVIVVLALISSFRNGKVLFIYVTLNNDIVVFDEEPVWED